MASQMKNLPNSTATLFSGCSAEDPALSGSVVRHRHGHRTPLLLRKPLSRAVCGLAIFGMLGLSPMRLAAETLYWDSEGFFETEFVYYDDSANWWVFDNGFAPAWGIPFSTDLVIFGWLEAPTVVDFAANGVAGAVVFSDPAFSDGLIEMYLNGWSWTIGSELTVGSFDGSGNVEISDGFVEVDRVWIGEEDFGSLLLDDATLTASGSFSTVGDLDGVGDLVLVGSSRFETGGVADLVVGYDGGDGLVILEDPDSSMEVADLYLGHGLETDWVMINGTGSLSVDGGIVEADSVILALEPGDEGNVALSGFDSWLLAGFVTVGDRGDGLLTMDSGALMEAEELSFGFDFGSIGFGTISGANTDVFLESLDPGFSSILEVGGAGIGSLVLSDDAFLATDRMFIGATEDGFGTMTIQGATLDTGDVFSSIGEAGGDGILTLSDGGIWNNGLGELVFGEDGGTGRMKIDGAGAAFATNSNVWLGANTDEATASRGEWLIANGSAEINGFLAIAGSGGTLGELTVSGANALLEVKGADFPDTGTLVGWAASGSMEVLAGGNVRLDSFLTVGALDGAEGDVLVSGAGSRLDIMGDFSGALRVAEDGEGTLSVSNGGVLTSENMEVGFSATSEGQVVVSGSGARIELNGSFAVGGSDTAAGGIGALEIRNNGVVDAGGAATFWQNSSLSLDGGTLIAGEGVITAGASVSGTGTIQGNVLSSSTTYRPGLSVGQLAIQGSWTLSGSDSVEMELGGAASSQNDRFIVDGGIQLNQAAFALSLLPSFMNAAIPEGLEITLISNASASTIHGQFSGVAEGAVIASGGYFFLASYVGGTGNDFTLTVINEPTAAYAAWSGGVDFNADANGDGVANGLAWVLGAADPSTNAIGLLPTFDHSSDPDFFIFTYRRKDDAHADASTTIAAEYSSNLTDWTEAVAGQDVIISVDENGAGAGIDMVEVKIRRMLAVGGRLFTRLRVEHDDP